MASHNGLGSSESQAWSDEATVVEVPALPSSDVYDAVLSPWRAAVRRRLVKSLESETRVLAAMQKRIRTPFLDKFFVYTSSLGTHTFFLAALPMCFFFGFDRFGRGLLTVLGMGVYLSSFMKDMFCSPRPFAPPVTRLTIGNHHLEYGFPSSHSTNSVSISILMHIYIYRLAFPASESEPIISLSTYYLSCAMLSFYTFSVVFGRLYAGMHSFVDCAFGVFLGSAINLGQWLSEEWMENWMKSPGWTVPVTIIPLALLMVHEHPVPVDNCPCFEDAIAFVSVMLGSILSRWHAAHYGFDESFYITAMPGSARETWVDIGIWCATAMIKLVVGTLIIVTWRILAKQTLHSILPPTFRLLAQLFTLPHRRFYTPATDYSSVDGGLRAVPSVFDLPSSLDMEIEEEFDGYPPVTINSKLRHSNCNGFSIGIRDAKGDRKSLAPMTAVQSTGAVHYDADVLTKVIVYCGISVLGTEVIPVLFEKVGLGVKSW